MAAHVVNAVPTRAQSDAPISSGTIADTQTWDRVIDYQLIEWGRNPRALEDDGIEAPTGEVILRARELAQILKNAGVAAPDTVVPDPNGGIVFERRAGDLIETFHVWDDGTVEYCRFNGAQLVERHAV